ncbi:MAG: hypothetical protein K6F56_08565 [Oscillospiraceae bacterium]|nr:hypothetical protein [Oscillospiraceae bacterium]
MGIADKRVKFFSDFVWSIAGLVLMNAAAQLLVYPYWNRVLGSEAYGNIVYLLGIMNIMAISVGSGVNYARMRRSAAEETKNRPYLLLMAAGTLLSILILFTLNGLDLLHLNGTEFLLFCLLTAATMWRYYADVEYRLHVNYKGYFLYYVIIGIGYLLGIWLFRRSGLWPLALLPGELAGLLFVLWRGSIFKIDAEQESAAASLSPILRLALVLIGSNVLSHLIFNGDRIILRLFAGSTAVSVYYIASLLGKTMTFVSTPLNGVLVGYLARYEGKLTRKLMNQVTGLTAAASVLATALCTAASLVILPFLYPNDIEEVRHFLLLANAAQVFYFVGNVLTASVLLRFTHARNQMIVNVVHGVLFVALCIPLTGRYGINGFCWGLLAVNVLRLLLCIGLGYRDIKE